MKATTLVLLCMLPALACAQNPLTLVGQYDGEAAEDYFGANMTCGDFNGDGYDEFIIGATGWNGHTGKSYIYPGGSEFPTLPAWTIQGQQANEGYAICSNLGDISGDNIDDFAIGTNTYGTTVDTAKLDIYFGSNPLDTIPDMTIYSAYHYTLDYWRADSCGDVNGDGDADFVAVHKAYGYANSCHIFWGGAELDTIPDLTFSSGSADQIDGLGDVNGDGFSDIMLRNYQGPALIYLGGSPMDTLPDLVFNEGFLFGGFGTAARDIDGDGYNDAAFCWDYADSLARDLIHLGGAEMNTQIDYYLMTWYGDASGSIHGMSCGDFNGDGLGDIIGTTGYFAGMYTVQIFLGGLNFANQADAFTSGSYLYEFGTHVGAGDLNGDNRDELLVAALNYPWFYQGRVYVYQGPETWTDYGVGVVAENPPLQPSIYRLRQNFPNPFNASTNIKLELQKPAKVSLQIFNLNGSVVKNLFTDTQLHQGIYEFCWSGLNDQNHSVSGGIYLLELRANENRHVIKMAFVP